jgi:hypothetical protein
VPLGQGVGALLLGGQKDPSGHAVGAVAPSGHQLPAGQRPQAEIARPVTSPSVPAGHGAAVADVEPATQ